MYGVFKTSTATNIRITDYQPGTALPHTHAHILFKTKPMAVAQVSASLSIFCHDARVIGPARAHSISRLPNSSFARMGTSFTTRSPLSMSRNCGRIKPARRAAALSIRCEQSTQESNGIDVWIGRLAMVGFAAAITVEITTGKGLLENLGLTSPLPTVALAVTGSLGVLAAVFIFQSASKD